MPEPISPAEPSFPDYRATAGEFIRHVAREFGDATLAVLDGERLTYRQAEERSAELAKGLFAAGARKGTRIGLLAPNRPDWIVCWLAAARIGGLVSLLNTYWKTRELGWVLRHADVQMLLTIDRHLGNDYLERLEGAAPGLAGQDNEAYCLPSLPYLRSVWTLDPADRSWCGAVGELAERGRAIGDDVLGAAEESVAPADPQLVVYSSGSTSDPKGAIHSHATVVRHPHNLLQFHDFGRGDVVYAPMPLFWVGGLSFTLLAAMHAGATVVFEESFDPATTLERLEREKVTHVLGWPHVSKALREHPSFPDRDLSSIRDSPGDGLVPKTEGAWERAQSLGMTETFGPHTIQPVGLRPASEVRGSYGHSVPGVEHRVVDPVTGAPVPPGALGELWVRGYSLMDGLYKKERSTVFAGDGWYRTGDGGFFDERGHFHYKGRMGDQIKSSGTLVTPREVELVLEGFEEVSSAYVMGLPHADRGEDIAAAVVLRPGAHAEPNALRARVKEEIASYKVPRHLAVLADSKELPWLASGKVDLRALKKRLLERFS
ncbi:MAG: class I adenylate-forming enzyme family protein [Candidatus Binatia bacterium]|nr:class I adenylate-forming enzyme family protein [Candidatus Binatia bacterium]